MGDNAAKETIEDLREIEKKLPKLYQHLKTVGELWREINNLYKNLDAKAHESLKEVGAREGPGYMHVNPAFLTIAPELRAWGSNTTG